MALVAGDRDRLRTTFDGAALLYDEVRPGYPEELFDDVVSLSGIPPGGRVLEIGCGTGQATLPFARRGFRILCIELGDNLAAGARRNLASYPRAEVLTADFEEVPLPEGAFDLAISATAFHWLDPTVAYPKVARALRPGGTIALFWNEHVFSHASGGFFEAAQEVYERETPEIVKPDDHKGLPQPHELPDRTAEIEASGLAPTGRRPAAACGSTTRSAGAPSARRRSSPACRRIAFRRCRMMCRSRRAPASASPP